MTTTADRRHQRDAAADRRADRDRLPDRPGRRARPRTTPTRCRRSRSKSQIPVIADIHFQPKYVFAAIDAGCAAVRVNPGNIKEFDDKVGEIARAATATPAPRSGSASTPARSTSGCMAKYGKATPEALVESALWECSLFEEHDFRDIKISVKHNDPVVMVHAYRLLAAAVRLPAAPRRHRGRARPSRARSSRRSPSARCWPRASATPSGSRCRRRRSRRSRSATQILESLGPPAARPGDRVLPVLRPRPGRRLHAGRAGHRRPRGPGGPAARRGHGLRRQRPGRGPRGRPRRRVRQRQGPDLRQGRGHQDRARVADRRDADRGGDADRRGDGGRGRSLGRACGRASPRRR